MNEIEILVILKSKQHNPHYLNRYWKFIKYCRNVNLTKTLAELGYVEEHHICPKAKTMFPEFRDLRKNKWNMIILTYEQHIIAHHMLAKTYGGGQLLAFNLMINTKSGKVKCLKILKVLKEAATEYRRTLMLGNSWNKGKKASPETLIKMSDSQKGKIPTEETRLKISETLTGVKHEPERVAKMIASKKGMVGTFTGKKHTEEANEKNRVAHLGNTIRKGSTHTEESKEKNRQAHLGKKHTEESKIAIGIGATGRVKSIEEREKISKGNTGKVRTLEMRAANSAARMGKGTGKRETCICPHCGLEGGVGMMKRYHFDNCKQNPNQVRLD